MADKAALERGVETRKKLNGRRFGKTSPAIAELLPDLEEIVNEVNFGRIWARPGLDLKTRSAVTIGIVIALGRLPQVEAYMANALNVGMTREELLELVMHTVFYAGLPAAHNAIEVAKKVLAEAGL